MLRSAFVFFVTLFVPVSAGLWDSIVPELLYVACAVAVYTVLYCLRLCCCFCCEENETNMPTSISSVSRNV